MSSLNMNRLRTKKVVSLFPGIHLRKLQRVTNTSFNTTRYHVHNLERDGEIVCSTEGGLTRIYPVGLDERARKVQAMLLDKTARKILSTLLESGAKSNGDLSSLTSLAKSTVSEHIDSLRKADVVKRNVALDGSVTYEVQDTEEVARLMAAFSNNLMTVATDRFIDLWDL
ncbi:MAG: winged helix-turn-helix transcriptional regulator [Candidatus Sulfotelmatobacter sp.]